MGIIPENIYIIKYFLLKISNKIKLVASDYKMRKKISIYTFIDSISNHRV